MTVQIKQDTAGVATFVAGTSGAATLTLPITTGTIALLTDITGVTGFTGSQNTASPNATVNASRLLVSATSVNADFVLQPKGNGSVLAQLPDSTATGGDKRDQNSVDLQTKRTAATQVASGYCSVISGGLSNTASGSTANAVGSQNTASGNRSAVGGGRQNTASGGDSVISGGKNNATSGLYGTIGGGTNNRANGKYGTSSGGYGNLANVSGATASGGVSNTASGEYSSVPGGRYGTTRSIYGAAAIASGRFGTQGDAQRGQYILRGLTTDATAKILTSDQAAASTSNQVVLPNNSSYIVRGLINSHRSDVIGTSATWSFLGTIRRGANAAATSVVAAITATSIAQDAGAMMPSPWAVAITADTTNGCLKVQFTGAASTTIRTVCLVETVEVTS